MALIPAPAGLFISSDDPTDQRWRVENIQERDTIKNTVAWEGMITYVKSERKWYRLVGTGTGTTAWEEWTMGGSVDLSPVETRLDTLEADQDKIQLETKGPDVNSTLTLKTPSATNTIHVLELDVKGPILDYNYTFPGATPQPGTVLACRTSPGKLTFATLEDMGVTFTPEQLSPFNSQTFHTANLLPTDGSVRFGFAAGYLVAQGLPNNTDPFHVWTSRPESGKGFQLAINRNGSSKVQYRINQSGWGSWKEIGGTPIKTLILSPVRIGSDAKAQIDLSGRGFTRVDILGIWQTLRSGTYVRDFFISYLRRTGDTGFEIMINDGGTPPQVGQDIALYVVYTGT